MGEIKRELSRKSNDNDIALILESTETCDTIVLQFDDDLQTRLIISDFKPRETMMKDVNAESPRSVLSERAESFKNSARVMLALSDSDDDY